jgi:hypothetical protein
VPIEDFYAGVKGNLCRSLRLVIHTKGMSAIPTRFATEGIRYATESFGIFNRMFSMGPPPVNLSYIDSPLLVNSSSGSQKDHFVFPWDPLERPCPFPVRGGWRSDMQPSVGKPSVSLPNPSVSLPNPSVSLPNPSVSLLKAYRSSNRRFCFCWIQLRLASVGFP